MKPKTQAIVIRFTFFMVAKENCLSRGKTWALFQVYHLFQTYGAASCSFQFLSE